MYKLFNPLIYLGLKLISLLPFPLLYLVSDFVCFLLKDVFKYRKKVIEQNLIKAYPNKTKNERSQILNKSYKNLADIMVEGIKSLSLTERQIDKRYIITNPEIANNYLKNNISVIAVGGHYCNWEWAPMVCNNYISKPVNILYKKLSNAYLNDKFIGVRQKFGALMHPINNTFNVFNDRVYESEVFVMVADQSPSKHDKAIWCNFMGIETACLHGPEKYARMFNLPILFMNFQRIKRGYYTLTLLELADNPNTLDEGKITQTFMTKLEEIINKQPENWLWSHRRWKQSKNEQK